MRACHWVRRALRASALSGQVPGHYTVRYPPQPLLWPGRRLGTSEACRSCSPCTIFGRLDIAHDRAEVAAAQSADRRDRAAGPRNAANDGTIRPRSPSCDEPALRPSKAAWSWFGAESTICQSTAAFEAMVDWQSPMVRVTGRGQSIQLKCRSIEGLVRLQASPFRSKSCACRRRRRLPDALIRSESMILR